MRVLPVRHPTPEQLRILQLDKPGPLIIRGAAGSGKTSTAIFRLRFLVEFWRTEFARENKHLRVLVLTYNRTLRGYVKELAKLQIAGRPNVSMEVETFGRWAFHRLGKPTMVERGEADAKLVELGKDLGWSDKFLADEVRYLLGRFKANDLSSYLTATRDGRGQSPRVPRTKRDELLASVVAPYQKWKEERGVLDWNDLATRLQETPSKPPYNIVVVDETQDFDANRIRAVMKHVAERSSLTFVLDGAQRIYANHFTWSEVDIRAIGITHTLHRNYRNTRKIAAFVRPILDGLSLGDDATMPDMTACVRSGHKPILLSGLYSRQVAWAVDHLRRVDLNNESVAFLKPKGGGFFTELRRQLDGARLRYETITRQAEWPGGATNIALCTMHSAKGLEFDHVFLLGLSQLVTPHGTGEGDVELEGLRRLLAMACGRARKSVVVGYKPSEESTLMQYLDPNTYTLVPV